MELPICEHTVRRSFRGIDASVQHLNTWRCGQCRAVVHVAKVVHAVEPQVPSEKEVCGGDGFDNKGMHLIGVQLGYRNDCGPEIAAQVDHIDLSLWSEIAKRVRC